MLLAYLALAGRIVLSGYERIIFKQAGHSFGSEEAVFIIFICGTALLLPLVPLAEAPQSWAFLWPALASATVYSIQTVLYLRALSSGEASLVGPLYYFSLFFLLILTTLFLGEHLGLFKVGGVVLLFYGASFLNRQGSVLHSLRSLADHPACRLMLVSSALVAVGRTIDAHVVRDVHPITYTLVLCIITDVILLLHLLWRGKLPGALRLMRSHPWLSTASGAVDVLSYLLLMFAVGRIEMSVAEPASMLGLVVTVVLARLIFREDIRGRLVGVSVMLAGVWLLFV